MRFLPLSWEHSLCIRPGCVWFFFQPKMSPRRMLIILSEAVLLWQVPVCQLHCCHLLYWSGQCSWTGLLAPPSSKMSDGYNWSHVIQTPLAASWQLSLWWSFWEGILESWNDWRGGVSGVMDGCCWKDWGAHQAVRLPQPSEDLSPKLDAVENPTAAADGVFLHPPVLVISSSVGSVWKCKIQNIPFPACQLNKLNTTLTPKYHPPTLLQWFLSLILMQCNERDAIV